MLKYFNNKINNVPIKPLEKAHALTNSFVESQWEDSVLLSVVGEETAHGSFEFQNIEVWKNTVTNFDVRMLKNEKDYRRLQFKELGRDIERGRLYNFDDNHWITYEPTTSEAPYCDVLVRRCNNIAKWVDVDTGEIVEMPCVLEYDFTSTTPTINKDIIVANTSIVLAMQGNEKTLKLKKNQRFIFNGTPYKFVAYNNYMQEDYLSQDINMLFMDIDMDIEKPTDDLERGIADFKEYSFEVNINGAPNEQIQNYQGTLTADVIINGEVSHKAVNWTSNENATIDENGNYTLIGEIGSTATISAIFGSYDRKIDMKIVESITDMFEITITPLVSEIPLYETVILSANVYKNGEITSDAISYEAYGANDSCYEIAQNNNVFTITNKKQSTVPLNIRFYFNDIENNISIMLKALF